MLILTTKSERTDKMNSWHVGVAAEAIAAAQFARYTYDVSVQYGANQPEYDLIAVSGDKTLKISVKGSQDGSWGLTQSFKKGSTYHEAIQEWLSRHHKKTIFCLVQFKNVDDSQLPRMYLASPEEIAEVLFNETVIKILNASLRGEVAQISMELRSFLCL